jgi:AraC-like DNA-binding protein
LISPLVDIPVSGASWQFAACHERSIPEIDADLICIALSGARRHSLKVAGRDAGNGFAARGSVRIVPAQTPAYVDVDGHPGEPFACFHFYASAPAFGALGLGTSGRLSDPGPGEVDPWLEALARRLSDTAPANAPSPLESGYLALAALAHVAARYGKLAAPGARAASTGGLAAWQQRRALAFIEAHLERQISIAELAELCRLSPYHFARAFRRSLGQPPHSYMTVRRIERAKGLLSNPREGLLEVAAAVGYESGSHFAKVFRRSVGVTPSVFRKRL